MSRIPAWAAPPPSSLLRAIERRTGGTAVLHVGAPVPRRLPLVGLWAGGAQKANVDAVRQVVARTGIAHVGVDVVEHPGVDEQLAAWLDAVRELHVGLVLRVEDRRPTLDAIAELARIAPDAPIDCIVLVGPEDSIPSIGAVADLKDLMARVWRGTNLAIGTNGSFAALNRDWSSIPIGASIAFPVSPFVHADDDLSMVESLQALSDIVRTARTRGRAREVRILPLTVRRPAQILASHRPPDSSAIESPELEAAWMLGSLAGLGRAAATSVTYAAPSFTWSALGRLGLPTDLVGGAWLLGVKQAGDHPLVALGLRTGQGRTLILGNLSERACRVDVAGLEPSGMTASSSRDGRTVDLRAKPRRGAATPGSLTFEVEGHELIRLAWAPPAEQSARRLRA